MSIDATQLPPLPAPFPAANPFDPASIVIPVQPVPLVQYQDFWSWSAISGEPYAPALTTGATYSQQSGRSCYTLASTAAKVTFPNLPRIGPAQSATGKLTVSVQAYWVSGSAGSFNIYPFRAADANEFMQIQNSSGLYQVQYRTVASGYQTIVFNAPPTNTWNKFDWIYDEAAGTFDLLLAGVSLIGGPKPHFSTQNLACQVSHESNSTQASYLAGVKVAWS